MSPRHAGPPQWPPAAPAAAQHRGSLPRSPVSRTVSSSSSSGHYRPLAPAWPPPAGSSCSSTPRGYSSRGPRSYALALAGSCKQSLVSPAPAHAAGSRPGSAAVGRPGSAGYASKAAQLQASNSASGGSISSYNTPRPKQQQQQQQRRHSQQQQPWQELCSSKAQPQDSPRCPGTTAAAAAWQACGRPPAPHHVASTATAGSSLLLADCFRPSTAAGPASIHGVRAGRQQAGCGSRPHTAAAAIGRWWEEEGLGQQAHQLQQQQQLWCAAHEIDGRPATAAGRRAQ
jgi:hypothetical protein